MSDKKEAYSSGEGPVCPNCGRQYVADDQEYFDEANGMEFDCDECGVALFVQPFTTTTWTTNVK